MIVGVRQKLWKDGSRVDKFQEELINAAKERMFSPPPCKCAQCIYLSDKLICPAFLSIHENCRECQYKNSNCSIFTSRN